MSNFVMVFKITVKGYFVNRYQHKIYCLTKLFTKVTVSWKQAYLRPIILSLIVNYCWSLRNTIYCSVNGFI